VVIGVFQLVKVVLLGPLGGSVEYRYFKWGK